MKRYGYERLTYNNRKHFIDWFFAEPVKVAIVIAFALADCATVFIVFDTYLPQNQYLTYALTILFSLGLSLIPVQLAFALRLKDTIHDDAETSNHGVKNKKLIIFLLSLEAFAFSAQMIGRLFTTKSVTGVAETISLDGSGAGAGESAITAADYYGSILLGVLPLIFGGIIFALHYLAKEDCVMDARIYNKNLDREMLINRIREQLMSMGTTEDFIRIQMTRLEEQSRSIISAANIEHIARVTDSQTEMAMKNGMNPADAHNMMVEPYMINADNSRMDT